MTSLLLGWLFAAPPLAEVVEADAMAWLHAPKVGASLSTLERGGFADLAALLLPANARRALAAVPEAEMVVATYRAPEPGRAEATLWLDAGAAEAESVAMMERWLGQSGFAAGERRERNGVTLHTLTGPAGAVTVFAGRGRCGWSSEVGRAQRMLTRAREPLAADPAFRALAARTPDASVRARLDVQKLYGMLARTPRGPRLAGQIRRLGLDGVTAVELHGSPRGNGQLVAEVRISLPKPWRDLPAALGPPVPIEQPAMVPPAAQELARVSVKPADLWYVAEKLYGYERAVESSLVAAQLDAVERRLGHSFTEDALGHEARVWTTWTTGAGRVLVAGVADGKLAATLLGAYAEVLPTFFPDLAVNRRQAGRHQLLDLTVRGRPLVTLGFAADVVVVGASRAQVEGALGARAGRARSAGATPAVAHGRGLTSVSSLLPAAARESLGRHPVSWQLRTLDDGLVLRVLVRAR